MTEPRQEPDHAYKNILLAGASVAGPATAFWPHHYGFTTTVVK